MLEVSLFQKLHLPGLVPALVTVVRMRMPTPPLLTPLLTQQLTPLLTPLLKPLLTQLLMPLLAAVRSFG
jgi:hypothetical protein